MTTQEILATRSYSSGFMGLVLWRYLNRFFRNMPGQKIMS